MLTVIGLVLVTMAVAGSRSGPPQPSLAVAEVTSVPLPTSVAASDAAPVSVPAAVSVASVPSTSSATPTPLRPVLPSSTGLVLKPSPPTSLSIPAIGARSVLLDLGLNVDGTVEVPSLDDPASKAGWYRNSPTPGSLGPAIILGHVDSKKYGPGIFYRLGELRPGKEIDVARSDGKIAVFRVDTVHSCAKDAFPSNDVYGNIDHAGLRLITCGGTFDRTLGSYQSNIVVYASLAGTRSP